MMSNRAEEKALEIFPVKKVPFYGLAGNAYSERDANLDKRALFCMGYEQAGKDLAGNAIDAEIVKDIHNLLHVKSNVLPMPSEHKFGDKVKIIILPNE